MVISHCPLTQSSKNMCLTIERYSSGESADSKLHVASEAEDALHLDLVFVWCGHQKHSQWRMVPACSRQCIYCYLSHK